MDLIRLPLDKPEELIDAIEAVEAVHDDIKLLLGQLFEGNVDGDVGFAGDVQQVSKVLAPAGGVPGMNGPLPNGLVGIWYNEVHIDAHRAAKSLAFRTGPDRVVEREHSRVGILIANPVVLALVMLRKMKQLLRVKQIDVGVAIPLDKCRLDGIRQASLAFLFVLANHEAINQNEDALLALASVARLVEVDELAVHDDTEEAALLERIEFFFERVPRVIMQWKGDVGFGPVRLELKVIDDAGYRVSLHQLSARAAIRLADATEEKSEVVVDLGGCSDRRAWIACRGFLLDRDGRTDALDKIHIRLVHSLEKLACVGGEAFDVSSLPFGVDGVEGKT